MVGDFGSKPVPIFGVKPEVGVIQAGGLRLGYAEISGGVLVDIEYPPVSRTGDDDGRHEVVDQVLQAPVVAPRLFAFFELPGDICKPFPKPGQFGEEFFFGLEVIGNHHFLQTGDKRPHLCRFPGQAGKFPPVTGEADTSQCSLYTLEGPILKKNVTVQAFRLKG
jgi:hypothetical protein